MNYQPIKQTELFELEENFNEISNLFNSEIHTNKILLSGPKGSGKGQGLSALRVAKGLA